MIKAIWKDPVWSKIIAAGMLGLITIIGTYLTGVWPVIVKWIIHAWNFITSNTSTPNWLLGLMTILCVLFIFLVLVNIKDRFSQSKPVITYRSYTKDNFEGLLWSWDYFGNRIDQLQSLCPECHYEILPQVASSYYPGPLYDYSCEECGYTAGTKEGYPDDLNQKIELKIQKNVRTGQWKEQKY